MVFFFLLQHVLLQTDFYVELANINYVADFDNCQTSLRKKKKNEHQDKTKYHA